ncbi:putative Valine--tRNA ligase [Paratrimastix pyriformis]|uniref:valine--tRNA ligase n=1 Tax=Paratrimastix pyriformis TaxID=342808 RepID=A0ABQ8UM49_9EUKA|nr:putative Valine--tRNA ligase [Paratrimastix pyriformis]
MEAKPQEPQTPAPSPAQEGQEGGPLGKHYNPKDVEAGKYEEWMRAGYFHADPNSPKPKYTIVIPPPNVTGTLHLGHALFATLQDILVRWKRMSGFEALWVPGTDHAGIATQVVVEKKLARQGISRHQLGREAFLKEVWKWKEESGSRICEQLKMMGASLDWDRLVFTLDETRSRAVAEAFVRMFNEKLIYRAKRLVNWSCALQSAISDIEVDKKDLKNDPEKPLPRPFEVPGYDHPVYFGEIEDFVYPIEGGGELRVSTTRLETMLGDTAIAVHPSDARYKSLHGKFARHPFFPDRRLPIVADAVVEMGFGTGAVKITPAHDQTDFEIGQRHHLPSINVFTDDGHIVDFFATTPDQRAAAPAAQFVGMKRYDARLALREALTALGLYRGRQPHEMILNLCSRSKDIIEPMMKPQWFVDMKDMAKAAADAVRTGEVEIVPPEFKDVWYQWLDPASLRKEGQAVEGEVRDWCISRQLWWGHRIPAYFMTRRGEPLPPDASSDPERWAVARDRDEAMRIATARLGCPAAEIELAQDEDVLDTWFSSGLFPFSVFGWPEQTADLNAFFPTAALETGHDILFFWVARMVMMSLKLMGRVPFKQVLLHALVRDKTGKKMSKSSGNVIDPAEVINGRTLEDIKAHIRESHLDPREEARALAAVDKDYPRGICVGDNPADPTAPGSGIDGLRFALAAYAAAARNINLDADRVYGYRMFCGKIFGAANFILKYIPPEGFRRLSPAELKAALPEMGPMERWIMSRLQAATRAVIGGFEKFDMASSATAIYNLFWDELCDHYLESVKPHLREMTRVAAQPASPERDAALARYHRILSLFLHVLDQGLRLAHPIIPFLTEHLYQRLPRLPGDTPSIVIAAFPVADPALEDAALEARTQRAFDMLHALNAMRSATGLGRNQMADFFIESSDPAAIANGEEFKEALMGQSRAQSLHGYMHLKGLVDPERELGSLYKRMEDTVVYLASVLRKTIVRNYGTKVPEAVRRQNKEKIDGKLEELCAMLHSICNFEKLRLAAASTAPCPPDVTVADLAVAALQERLWTAINEEPERPKVPKGTPPPPPTPTVADYDFEGFLWRTAAEQIAARVPGYTPRQRAAQGEQPGEASGKAGKKDKAAKKEKAEQKAAAAAASPAAAPKAEADPFSQLDLRVGRVLSVERHPQADTLYVEQIDLGEGAPRQVVSGLARVVPQEQLQGAAVVVLCNLKPAKLKGVESNGMVLAAVPHDADPHASAVLELLQPPADAAPGTRLHCGGEAPAAPKQVAIGVWQKAQPEVSTDPQCTLTYKGVPVLAGPHGPVRVATIVAAKIA